MASNSQNSGLISHELNNVLADSLSKSAALTTFLKPLAFFFEDPQVTEIVINKPGEVWTETNSGWQQHHIPAFTFSYCMKLAALMGNYTQQRIDETNPILSVTLPAGQRCQIVVPPATRQNEVSFTIRKPSSITITLDDYDKAGAFDHVIEVKSELSDNENKLLSLKQQRKYREFIELSVRSHQNVLISGATGSGKTTFAKSVVTLVPENERLISIENVDELKLNQTHPNTCAMFYSAGGQGLSTATPQLLMQSSLRQKPDRVFLAEMITGDEAFYFLDTVSSGHPGSISTMHSETPALCIERLINLIRRSKDGRTMTTEDIRKMIHMCIDVIIQFKVVYGADGKKRRNVTEIYYDPVKKKSLMG